MNTGATIALSSGRRMSGPAQRAGRSERVPHPLEYQMYYML